MTEREYLVSLGLAKPGRGRFSSAAKEALAKAKADGMTFEGPAPAKQVAKASKPKPTTPKDSSPEPKDKPKYDAKAIRKWAESHGIDVPSRGRLPASVVEQYVSGVSNPELAKEKFDNPYHEPPRTTTATKWFGAVGDITITKTDRDVCNGCGYSLSHHICGQPRHLMVDGTFVPLFDRPLV